MGIHAIYRIVNTVNGHEYVGSAVDLDGRWRMHRHQLRRNKHHSPYLQAAWNLHGPDAFQWLILEEVEDVERLIEREQWHIDARKPAYNISPIAGSSLGVKLSEQTRERMRIAQTGRVHSEESKRLRSEKLKGRAINTGLKHPVASRQTRREKMDAYWQQRWENEPPPSDDVAAERASKRQYMRQYRQRKHETPL